MRRTISTVLSSPQKRKDKFPFPLLFKSPRSKALDPRNTEMSVFTEVEHHVLRDTISFSISVCTCEFRTISSSLIQAQETTNVRARIFLHNLLQFWKTQYTMSSFSLPATIQCQLYIDMKIILPCEFLKFTLNFSHHVSGSRRESAM